MRWDRRFDTGAARTEARRFRWAALAGFAVLVAACAPGSASDGPPAAPPAASGVPATAAGAGPDGATPTTGAVPVQAPPSSPVDLRVAFESLLGHHASLVTRLMRTVLRGDPDLVEAANQALVLNTADLSEVIAGLRGRQAGDDFAALWVRHNDLLVDYARAVGDGDAAAQTAARAGLDAYRDEFGAFVEGATAGALPAADAAGALGPHLDHLTGFADAFAAGDPARAFALQRDAFAHMFPVGRALADALRDPAGPATAAGDPSEELRSTLGLLLGEHFELMVDGMRAVVRAEPEVEFDAAAEALGANQAQLTGALDALVGPDQAARFNEAWAHHIELLVQFAVAIAEDDTAARDAARAALRSARDHIAESFSALTGGAIPVAAAATALSPHDDLLVEQLEAYAAGDYARAHEVAFDGYQHMFDTVAVVAPAIAAHLAAGAPVGPAQTGGGGLSAAGWG